MKKIHLINSLVLALLTTWTISCIYIIIKYDLPESSAIWVQYLWWLMLFFWLFWIFMKYWEFIIKEECEILENNKK